MAFPSSDRGATDIDQYVSGEERFSGEQLSRDKSCKILMDGRINWCAYLQDCFSVVPEDAEEIFQCALANLLVDFRSSFSDERTLTEYFQSLLRDTAANFLRKNKANRRVLEQNGLSRQLHATQFGVSTVLSGTPCDSREESQLTVSTFLSRFIDSLPPYSAFIFFALTICGRSNSEIGEDLRVAEDLIAQHARDHIAPALTCFIGIDPALRELIGSRTVKPMLTGTEDDLVPLPVAISLGSILLNRLESHVEGLTLDLHPDWRRASKRRSGTDRRNIRAMLNKETLIGRRAISYLKKFVNESK